MLFIILRTIISFILGFEWCVAIKNCKELLNAKTWDEYNELIDQGELEAKETNILVIIFRVITRLPISLIMMPILGVHVFKLKRESK